jgi:mannose-6-phosphate isomerase-like protein (cupin superfamily)
MVSPSQVKPLKGGIRRMTLRFYVSAPRANHSVAPSISPQENAMKSECFFRLADILRSLATDPATAADPIKRTFLCDGEAVSCNVNILEDGADVIHIQPAHDELVLVLEGKCGFRVGDEIRRVEAGDLMFIPRDTVHGPIIDSGRVALLSIIAPFFDRTKKNIRWSRDAFA